MTDPGEARRRKTVTDIDAEIARLKEQRTEVRARSVERLLRIASRSAWPIWRCRTKRLRRPSRKLPAAFAARPLTALACRARRLLQRRWRRRHGAQLARIGQRTFCKLELGTIVVEAGLCEDA